MGHGHPLPGRCRPDRLTERAPGSSLDPSAEAVTKDTTRMGFDLTMPLETKGKSFVRADFPQVDLKKFGLENS